MGNPVESKSLSAKIRWTTWIVTTSCVDWSGTIRLRYKDYNLRQVFKFHIIEGMTSTSHILECTQYRMLHQKVAYGRVCLSPRQYPAVFEPVSEPPDCNTISSCSNLVRPAVVRVFKLNKTDCVTFHAIHAIRKICNLVIGEKIIWFDVQSDSEQNKEERCLSPTFVYGKPAI